MATRYFDLTLSGDVNYVGERWWKGDDINKLWNLFNYNSDNRATWGLDANGWLQYRSQFATYAGRYNPDDITLGDTYFEVDLQAAGMGNYEVGFFMRFIDRYTFYYLTFNGGYKNWGTKNIRLYKVSGTTHTMVAEADSPVFNTATVYKFRCVLTGNNVQIFKDNVQIINWTDTSPTPYKTGAFGPWVLGQEFAKWRGFQAKNNSPFSVSQQFKNENVTNTAYDPVSAKMISPQTVGTLLADEVQAYLATVAAYDTWSWRSFRLSTTDGRVLVVFDKTAGKNTTTDANSRMYAYQTLPTSPPLAPTNLQGLTVDKSTIKLSWSHADDSEDGFRIYDENDVLIATVGENVLNYTEIGLNEGTTYYRKVRAYNNAGESAATSLIAVRTAVEPPKTPSNFQGVAVSDVKIRWSWTPQSTNEDMFELVTWDTNSNLIVAVTAIPKGSTSYDEDGLTPSTRYVRAVRAKNVAGTSVESNPFEVTTQAELPKPPKNAPVNFYGLGVSDTTIFWYWLDTNDNEDGFELLDKDDNVIAVIGPNEQVYIETGLYSKNVYQRKLRAFNTGGPGPETLLASATTLSDGIDQTGKPVPPTDLRATVLGTTSASLTWLYEDDEHVPAVGFKLYMSDGSFMHAIPVDERTHILDTLLPNTTYRLYLTAYNERGDSLRTNIVEFVTPHIVPPIPTPIDPSDLEDPYYGIAYDEETLDMAKLSAFQSGIGDKLDLVVRNLQPTTPNLEVFSYEVYITGEYTHIFEGVQTPMVWESARVVGNQREVMIGETISFTEQIASPLFEVGWQDINSKFPISNYKLIYTSSNANVEVILEREITDFFPQGKVYIELPMKARIVNETQTAWYPSIHAGYYYLNQQEWFLYVDDKVQPKDGGFDEEYILRFPYIIRAHGGRHYDAQDFRYVDTTKADFLQGEFDSNIDLEREAGAMTIRDLPTGVFTSRIFRFGRPVTSWYNIEVDWDTDSIAAGASVTIEVADCDYLGNVTNWYPQVNGAPISLPVSADKIRYRLTLNEGFRKDLQSPQFKLESWQLDQGYKFRTLVAGDTVMISDPQNNLGGTYITPALDLGDHIETLGTITMHIELPGTSAISLYSVTYDDPATDYTAPSAAAPWIPLQEVSRFGNDVTYKINSAHARFLRIAMNLQRGTQAGPTVKVPRDNPTQDGVLQNVSVTPGTGDWQMINPNEPAYWKSNPIFLSNPQSVKVPSFRSNPVGGVKILITSGDTYQDAVNLGNQPDGASTWRVVTGGQEVSNLRPWIVMKVVLVPHPVNCGATSYIKDITGEFNTNNGSSNWLSSNGSIEQVDPTQASVYSSEVYAIGYLSQLSSMKLTTNYPTLVKVYVSVMKDGVWQPESALGLLADGSVNVGGINAAGASHFRYRIEVAARQAPGSGGSGGGGTGGIVNEQQLGIAGTLTDATHPATQDELKASTTNLTMVSNGRENSDTTLTYPAGNHTWSSKQLGQLPTTRDEYMGTYEYLKFEFSSGYQYTRYTDVSTGQTTWESHVVSQSSISVMMRMLAANGSWTGWRAVVPQFDSTKPETSMMVQAKATDFGLTNSGYSAAVGFEIQVFMQKGRQTNKRVINNVNTEIVMDFAPQLKQIRYMSYRTANPYYIDPNNPGGGGSTTLPKVKIDKVEVYAVRCDLAGPVVNELNGGAIEFTSSGYVTPSVSAMLISPVLFTLTRVIPKVYEVRIGGHIAEGYANETYAVPMMGELVTDFKEYAITDKIVEDIVYEYMAGRGVIFDNSFQFTDYQLDVDPIYPVILRTDPNGLDRVYGKATRQAGELLYRNVQLYFGEADNGISLRPIPQNGSPICIKNAAGQLLRPVHFRDEYGAPTLTNIEEPMVEYSRYLFLQHTGIDERTLEVYLQIDGKYVVAEDVQLIGDRVVLSKAYPNGTAARVKYKLANSFCVDYNVAPLEDYCNIKVNTPYDPGNLETRKLEIKYERKKDTPYYLAKEVDLNPLRTVVNSGFMYLTDTVYPPFNLEVFMNPNVLYRDKDDRVIINAIVQDEFGNPVVGEKADFTTSLGGIQVLRRVSDENGMVSAVYTAPKGTDKTKSTVNIQIVSRDISKQISKTVEIFFVDSQATNKIAIIPEKHIVNVGDVVKLKVKVMGANDEPLAGRNVSLYADQGTLSLTIGTTDAQGEINLEYAATRDAHRNVIVEAGSYETDAIALADFSMSFEFVNRYLESEITDGFAYIEAETYDDTFKTIREQILLGVNGV